MSLETVQVASTWTFSQLLPSKCVCVCVCVSGVAKLGHTGARALAIRGCAPPVQGLLKIIGTECTVINRELGAKSAQKC